MVNFSKLDDWNKLINDCISEIKNYDYEDYDIVVGVDLWVSDIGLIEALQSINCITPLYAEYDDEGEKIKTYYKCTNKEQRDYFCDLILRELSNRYYDYKQKGLDVNYCSSYRGSLFLKQIKMSIQDINKYMRGETNAFVNE